MPFYTLLFVVFFLKFNFSYAQDFRIFGGEKSYTTKFKLVHNLIVLPIEVNGKELTFILDSGVSAPVIFNITAADSLQVNNSEKILIRGLGDNEPLEAVHSKQNKFKLGKVLALNQDLYIIYKDKFDFSSRLGITVHGLIGYSLFKNFVVTINYTSKKITFTKPKLYKYRKCRKCETFNLEFYRNKPYINGKIVSEEPTKSIPVKLLIDTGGSDSLWLFEDENVKVPTNSFDDFIGEGISGTIYGKRSRLKSFSLKGLVLKEPNVAYLDTLSTLHARKFKSRNGSLGGNILKRFTVVFDYPRAKITLKKNSNFKKKFGYNLSGIELMYAGKELVVQQNDVTFELYDNRFVTTYGYIYKFKPIYKIYHIRQESSAQKAGVREGDFLLKINGVDVYNYSLQEINEKFHGKDGELVKIVVSRNGLKLNYEFRLKDILK